MYSFFPKYIENIYFSPILILSGVHNLFLGFSPFHTNFHNLQSFIFFTKKLSPDIIQLFMNSVMSELLIIIVNKNHFLRSLTSSTQRLSPWLNFSSDRNGCLKNKQVTISCSLPLSLSFSIFLSIYLFIYLSIFLTALNLAVQTRILHLILFLLNKISHMLLTSVILYSSLFVYLSILLSIYLSRHFLFLPLTEEELSLVNPFFFFQDKQFLGRKSRRRREERRGGGGGIYERGRGSF